MERGTVFAQAGQPGLDTMVLNLLFPTSLPASIYCEDEGTLAIHLPCIPMPQLRYARVCSALLWQNE